MTPDLRTISGFAPKFSGFHRTRSASLPTSTEPTYLLMPCVMALRYYRIRQVQSPGHREAKKPATYGLIVYLEIYLFTLPLSHSDESHRSTSGPLHVFILLAVRHVRETTSPTRPIACESELIIDIAPVSCNTSSAATVSARMRDSAKARSSGMDLSR